MILRSWRARLDHRASGTGHQGADDQRIRPIFHWLPDLARAHVCLCLSAYDVEWHVRQKLGAMLYEECNQEAGDVTRAGIVAKAQRSPTALSKPITSRTEDGPPVQSFRTRLSDLATIARNTVITAVAAGHELIVVTRPAAVQGKHS